MKTNFNSPPEHIIEIDEVEFWQYLSTTQFTKMQLRQMIAEVESKDLPTKVLLWHLTYINYEHMGVGVMIYDYFSKRHFFRFGAPESEWTKFKTDSHEYFKGDQS